MNDTPDDPAIDTALRGLAAHPLPDDGFTERVMRRVRALPARAAVPPADALARALQGMQRLRLQQRSTLIGAALGALPLLATLGAAEGIDAARLASALGALLVAAAALAWTALRAG